METSIATGSPNAAQVWSKLVYEEALNKAFVGKFTGKGMDNMIVVKDDLSKTQGGDTIYVTLRTQLAGYGISGDGTMVGNEEALTFFRDSVVINQIRNAVRSEGMMTEQRLNFDLRVQAKNALADWFAASLDSSIANQLTGNTAETDLRRTGNNAVTAVDSNHIIRAGGVANDESLGAGNPFSLSLIDSARARALNLQTTSGVAPIRPFNIDGEDYFAIFLHPDQVQDLRSDTSTGSWQDIQKSAMAGGAASKNPIFTGALGVYNRTVIHEWSRLPKGISSATGLAVDSTRRAVFCGAQAGVMAFGSSGSVANPLKMNWYEEVFDYGNKWGIAVSTIYGAKASVFNSKYFGAIVIPTYAAAN